MRDSFKLCGERGITFGDPFGKSLAMTDYSLIRFTHNVFLFLSLSILRLESSKNKNPPASLRD